MAAAVGLIACTAEEPQPNPPSTPATESPAERFDAHVTAPFCDLTTAGIELPSRETVDYTEEQGTPDDDGSVITYTCFLLPSEEEQFDAASQGRAYAVIRTVLSIARDELISDPSLPAMPVPFSAADLDWEDFGEKPDAHARTMHCPAEGECGDVPTIEMSSYERMFKATHQNIYIEMTVAYEVPLDAAAELPDPAEYALGSYESYATHLIQNLPRE